MVLLVCLRTLGAIHWSWTWVLFPMWVCVIVAKAFDVKSDIEAIKEAWSEIPKDKCEKYETLKESFE